MQVRHEQSSGTFLIHLEGHEARLNYEYEGKVMVITHTYVPPGLRGRGVAARLVETALAFAQKENLKVDPQCSYVDTFMSRYKKYGSLRV